MLELFKKLSPIELDDDTLAEYYLSIGKTMVERYINNEDIDVEYLYSYQIVQTAIWLVSVAQQSQATTENGGIQTLSANGRSITWFSLDTLSSMELPSHIKAQLPHHARVW